MTTPEKKLSPQDDPTSWLRPGRCVFCGASDLRPWLTGLHDRLHYIEGTWSFLLCRACGSTILSPVPAPAKIPGLYPTVYSFKPDFGTKSRAKKALAAMEEHTFYRLMHWKEVARIARNTGISTGTMLDVGCGTGDRLSRFARRGFKVRGIEINPGLVESIRTRLGFEVDAGSLDTVSYPPNGFDIVTIYWVIEHLLDVKSALNKIWAILRPKGWIVAEVPLSDSYQSSRLGRRWSQYLEVPRHIGIPSRAGMKRILTECGFTDIRILPSTIMNCSGFFALSLIPTATAMHAYDNAAVRSHIPRLIAGGVTILYFPVAFMENRILRRPACGLVFARKPG